MQLRSDVYSLLERFSPGNVPAMPFYVCRVVTPVSQLQACLKVKKSLVGLP